MIIYLLIILIVVFIVVVSIIYIKRTQTTIPTNSPTQVIPTNSPTPVTTTKSSTPVATTISSTPPPCTPVTFDQYAKTYTKNANGVCGSSTCNINFNVVNGKCQYISSGLSCVPTLGSSDPNSNYLFDNFGNCMVTSCKSSNYSLVDNKCVSNAPLPVKILKDFVDGLIKNPYSSAGMVGQMGAEMAIVKAFGKKGFNKAAKALIQKAGKNILSKGTGAIVKITQKLGMSALKQAGVLGGKIEAAIIKKAISKAGTQVASKLATTATTTAASGPGSIFVGPALLLLTGVSMGLDVANVGGFANFTTMEAFNEIKQNGINAMQSAFSDAGQKFPVPIGPLDKISQQQQGVDIQNIISFLYDISTDNSNLISREKKMDLLKPMLLAIQRDIDNNVITNSTLNDPDFMDPYYAIIEQAVLQQAQAIYCELNGGLNIINTNGDLSCTYATKDDCDNSYSWPPDNTGSLPENQIYGEWKPYNAKSVPSGTLYPWVSAKTTDTTDACVMGSFGVKSACYNSGLEYDAVNGLCTITADYCTKGGLSYNPTNKISGVPNDLADCTAGPAEQFLQSFLGTTITQFFNKEFQSFVCAPILSLIFGNLCQTPQSLTSYQAAILNSKSYSDSVSFMGKTVTNATVPILDHQSIVELQGVGTPGGSTGNVNWQRVILSPVETPFNTIYRVSGTYSNGRGWSTTSRFCWNTFTNNFITMFNVTAGLTQDTNKQLKLITGGVAINIDLINLNYNPVLKFMMKNASTLSTLCRFINLFRTTETFYPNLTNIFIMFPGLFVYYYNLPAVDQLTFTSYLINNLYQLNALGSINPKRNNVNIIANIISTNTNVDIKTCITAINNTILTNDLIMQVALYINADTMKNATYPSNYMTLLNKVNYLQLYFSTNLPCLFFMLNNPSYISVLANDINLQMNLITTFNNITYNQIANIFTNYKIFNVNSNINIAIKYAPNLLTHTEILNSMIQNQSLSDFIQQDPVNYQNYYNLFIKDFIEYPTFATLLQNNTNLIIFFGKNYNLVPLLRNNTEILSSLNTSLATGIDFNTALKNILQLAINNCNATIRSINTTYNGILTNLDNDIFKDSAITSLTNGGKSINVNSLITFFVVGKTSHVSLTIETIKKSGITNCTNFKISLDNLIKQLEIIQPLFDTIFTNNPSYMNNPNFFTNNNQVYEKYTTNQTFYATIPGIIDNYIKVLPLIYPTISTKYINYYKYILTVLMPICVNNSIPINIQSNCTLITNGVYTIKYESTKYILGSSGTSAILANTPTNSRWAITCIGNNIYTLKNVLNNMYLIGTNSCGVLLANSDTNGWLTSKSYNLFIFQYNTNTCKAKSTNTKIDGQPANYLTSSVNYVEPSSKANTPTIPLILSHNKAVEVGMISLDICWDVTPV